jgi:hypothetical protein
MTHAVSPIVGEINQQYKTDPIPPRIIIERKECEFLEQQLIDPNTEDLEEQTGQLGRYPAANIRKRIGKPVQLLVSEPFNQQFNPYQDEKNRNRKYDRVYVHDVFPLFAPNLTT